MHGDDPGEKQINKRGEKHARAGTKTQLHYSREQVYVSFTDMNTI